MGGKPLNAPIVATVARRPDGKGYWEVASDGGIFNFGDAGFYGSEGGTHAQRPVVGMAATPDGKGYWEVASDGGIFTFGDAPFYGSEGGKPLNAPVVGLAPTADLGGYWEVATDGGIFTFGDAGFDGSEGGNLLDGAGGRAWPPRPTAGATGSWPKTAGSSASAMPASRVRKAARPSRPRWWAWCPPATAGLLALRSRRRRLQPGRCRLQRRGQPGRDAGPDRERHLVAPPVGRPPAELVTAAGLPFAPNDDPGSLPLPRPGNGTR